MGYGPLEVRPENLLMKVENANRSLEPTVPAFPKKWLHFPRPVAWLVLAISLAASAGGWFVAWKHEDLAARKRFEDEARKISAALVERMQVYEDVLHGTLGLFAASYSVDRTELRAYLNSVSIERRFPGISGVGYLAYVPRTELAEFLRATQADGAPEFQVKGLGTADDLLVVKYLEPEIAHQNLLGRNVGEDMLRRTAAERASITGKAAVTGKLNLIEAGDEGRSGFWMLLPVYRRGVLVETAPERRAAIQGWVFARFVTEDLMRAILGANKSRLHLRVLDEEAGDPATVLFDQDPQFTAKMAEREALFTTAIPLRCGERTWVLNFTTTPAFETANRHGGSTWAGAGGTVISLLLFAIAWSLSHTKDRALAIAAEMTRTLRETNDRLKSEIGERKRSEQALARSEVLYHSLVESLPLGIARKDLQGRFTFANQRFASELDKPVEEILGKTEAELFPQELAAERESWDKQVLRTGTTLETVEARPDPDNRSTRYVQAIRAPIYDSERSVIGLLGIFWDVTDKHQAEAELEHERFLLRTLMDNVPERIYFKDRESRFIRANLATTRLFGLEGSEHIMGKIDSDFFSEEHARQAYEDEQRVIVHGRPVSKEEKETWPDGSITWVLSTKMPLRDEHGEIVGTFGISRDITDRKRAEEAMRRAKDAAEEANQTKSRFLASMSHELRTPLNSVIGFANILLKNKAGTLSSAELSFLERILANGKHLLNLINEILDLSKIEARRVELQPSSVRLDLLVCETIAQQEGLVRDRPVALLADLPGVVAPIVTDPDKLRQVLINLIGNALKFTEEGSVTVRVTTDPVSNEPVRLEVIDTGIGIPKEKLGVIFEAFQQAEAGTARKYGGTGLGLTISQALCRLMGYHIEVASEPGKGSTFSVQLTPGTRAPVVHKATPAPTADTLSPRLSAGSLRDKLVLVIDDELDSRTLLTHAIEELGCQALAANSGEQGLRMAREFKPHLITVDLMMPQIDGWQVIQALKADPALCHIPVVVVSIVGREHRGRILGVVEVLQKPVARTDLLAALRRCLLSSSARILIVEDEQDSRDLLLAHLEGEACEVRTAEHGAAALQMMETFTPDLVLLDLLMPEMDGITFLNRLRSTPKFRFLPVVIITARELSLEETKQLGQLAEEVVQKGDHLEADLGRVLHRFLRQERRLEPMKTA